MEFDAKKIKKDARQNFEKTWLETAKLVTGERTFKLPERKGRKHLLTVYSDKARDVLLGMGFDEVVLKPIWEDTHVRLQYGPEAPAILDRLYYIASLPRPDIGLSEEKKKQIEKRLHGFNGFEELRKILMDYKREKIAAGEDFTEALVTRLKIKTEDALYLINEVFQELKHIEPVASNLALVSHLTTAWFPTLREIQDKKELPVMLFAFGWRYRREQREDTTHLKAHYNLSMVVMHKNFTIEDGKHITREFFERLGFKEIKFQQKANFPAYYAPGTNYEVFVKHEKMGWIEVSEIGMYSPVALAHYGIKYPVFNSGPGLGRIIMISEHIRDIREVHFPELYSELKYTDEQMVELIEIEQKPDTAEGKAIAEAIIQTSEKHGSEKAPCEFLVYHGKLSDKTVEIKIAEVEAGKKLLGPAAFNVIYVEDGNIIGDSKPHKLSADISYIEAIANLAAREFEKAVLTGKKEGEVKVKIVRSASDINVKISDSLRKFIMDKKKKIDIRGPVFISLTFKVK